MKTPRGGTVLILPLRFATMLLLGCASAFAFVSCGADGSVDLLKGATGYARTLDEPGVTPPAGRRFYQTGDALGYSVTHGTPGALIHCTVNGTEILPAIPSGGSFELSYSADTASPLNARFWNINFWATLTEYNDSGRVSHWASIALSGDLIPVAGNGASGFTPGADIAANDTLAYETPATAPSGGVYLSGWYYFGVAAVASPEETVNATTPYEIRAVYSPNAEIDSDGTQTRVVAILPASADPGDLGTPFLQPGGLAVRPLGTGASDPAELFVSDPKNDRILRVAIADRANPAPSDTDISIVGGATTLAANETAIVSPTGLAWGAPPAGYPGAGTGALGMSGAPAAVLYVADSANDRVIAVDISAPFSTASPHAFEVLTAASAGLTPALAAPGALAFDPDSEAGSPAPALYLADSATPAARRILKINLDAAVTTDASGITEPQAGACALFADFATLTALAGTELPATLIRDDAAQAPTLFFAPSGSLAPELDAFAKALIVSDPGLRLVYALDATVIGPLPANATEDFVRVAGNPAGYPYDWPTPAENLNITSPVAAALDDAGGFLITDSAPAGRIWKKLFY